MMKKLTLDVDGLQVESFRTSDGPAQGGTVIAADARSTIPPYCFTFTCGDSHIRPCMAD
jgi:hypothetical protein